MWELLLYCSRAGCLYALELSTWYDKDRPVYIAVWNSYILVDITV